MTEQGPCPACGVERDPAAKFCANCGASFADGAPPKAVAEGWSLTSMVLIGVAGILVLAIAAVAYLGSFSGSSPEVAAGTAPPLASVRPAATPKPAPSGVTSSEPTPSIGTSAGWVAYYEHLAAVLGQQVSAIDAIEAAIYAESDSAESAAIADLAALVDNELAWLRNHHPDDCYADLYQQELEATEQLRAGVTAYQDWRASQSAGDLERFTMAFAAASDSVRAITTSAQASDTCTPVHEGLARIGEKVSAGDHFVTVTKVEQWAGSGFVTPASGKVFITVQVEIEAIRSGEPFLLSTMLLTASGDGYRRELLGREPDVVSLPTMMSGETKSAWFTFEIPGDQQNGLVLDYRVGLTGPSIEFALD